MNLENNLVQRPSQCSRYTADTSVRFQWTWSTTQGACRALGCGTPNPRSPVLQGSGLWAWWSPVPLWHGHQDAGAALGVRQLCLPHTRKSQMSLGGMVPLSWVLCALFFFPSCPDFFWLVNTSFDSIMSSSLISLDLSLYVWEFSGKAKPTGYIQRLVLRNSLVWLWGLTNSKSGCSHRSWCCLESEICRTGQEVGNSSWIFVTVLRQDSIFSRKPRFLSEDHQLIDRAYHHKNSSCCHYSHTHFSPVPGLCLTSVNHKHVLYFYIFSRMLYEWDGTLYFYRFFFPLAYYYLFRFPMSGNSNISIILVLTSNICIFDNSIWNIPCSWCEAWLCSV